MESRIERNLDPAEVEAFLRPYLKRPMEDAERDFRFLCRNNDDLTAQYPDEWVAVFDCKVVAHSRERGEMWDQLGQLGLKDRSPVIELLETNPPTRIF